MMSRTHVAFGLLVGLLSLKYLNVPNPYIFIIMVCVASVIADIDNSNSRIGRKIKTVSWTIEKTFGHRNIFHSVFPLIIIFVIFFYILEWNVAGTALLIGYASHIFIDAFTHMGVGIFHPLHSKRIKGFIKTGGLAEHTFFFLLVLANIIVLSNII